MELPPRPEQINDLEFIRILAPYVFIRRMVVGKSILDIGCGFGHGTWLMMANGAKQVISFDLDKIKAQRVHELCSKFQNCDTLVMDAQRLGFKEHSFQVVTCFEVIEHVPEPDLLLSEIQRMLKRDGILLMTTPNRAMRLLPCQRPWNPEHLREHTLQTFRKSLRKYFPFFEILGIYGESLFYEHYKKIWKQNPFRNYLGFVIPTLRKLTPVSIRQWMLRRLAETRSKRVSHAPRSLNGVAPVGDPENWPFYLNDVSKECLNFFAIGGFDHQTVQRSVKGIRGTTLGGRDFR